MSEDQDAAGWFEERPDERGEFDELIVRFGDGLVHMEMLDDGEFYLGFTFDDGRHAQLWGASKKRLRIHHEHGVSDPPRYTAAGVDRRPDLPDYTKAIECPAT